MSVKLAVTMSDGSFGHLPRSEVPSDSKSAAQGRRFCCLVYNFYFAQVPEYGIEPLNAS